MFHGLPPNHENIFAIDNLFQIHTIQQQSAFKHLPFWEFFFRHQILPIIGCTDDEYVPEISIEE